MAVDGPLIRVRDLSFHYDPERPLLDGLSLDVAAGERIGLVGANGSGKTTLLHLLVGLLKPTAGEIEAFGHVRRTERDFRPVRARLGLVFQDPEDQLFCPTVAEDVAFGPLNLGKSHGEAMAAVTATLKRLDLEHLAERVTYRLSFGEKKLVSIATVLAMEPEALLLDEPAAGLDEEHEARMVEVLNDLGLAMLVVSHDRAFLRRVTDRRLVLHHGRLNPDGDA